MDLKILDIASDTDNFRAIKDHTHNSKFKKSMQEQEKYSKHEIEYQDKISGKHRWKRDNMNQHEF